MLPNTAGEKVRKLLDRCIDYRNAQLKKLKDNPKLTIGDVTTVNVTKINGGAQSNVVPPEYKVSVDARIALDDDHEEFEAMIKNWCKESGDGITFKFNNQPKAPPTKTDKTNPYWIAFKEAIDEL